MEPPGNTTSLAALFITQCKTAWWSGDGNSGSRCPDPNTGRRGKSLSLDDEGDADPVWLRSPKPAREVADGIGEVS